MSSAERGVILEPAAQTFLECLATSAQPPAPGNRSSDVAVDEQWTTLDTLSVRIVRPVHATGPLPAVLYLHGGVRFRGDARTHRRIADELAGQTQAAVLVPEHTSTGPLRYPESLDQMYTLSRWIVDNAADLRLDPNRLAVVGDSVGGTLAISLTLRAALRREFAVRQLIAFYPATDAGCETLSHWRFSDGYHLSRADMQQFWEHYAPQARAAAEASPLRAENNDLIGFPPVLIITAEADVLRDEGESFAAKLRTVGVPTIAVRYEGMIHDFVVLDELADTVAAKAAIAQACAALSDAFR